MTSLNTFLGQVEDQVEKDQQAQLDLSKLFFAMGQNEVKVAALEEESTANFIIGNKTNTETALSARVRLQGELEAQAKKQDMADSIDYGALSMSLLEKTAQAANEAAQLSRTIQEKASVSLFDDPLQALMNSFTLPWDQQALESTTQRMNVLKKTSDDVNAQLSHFNKQTDETKTSLTQAAVDSLSKGIANEFQIKALTAHNKALMTNAQGIEAVSRASHQELQDRQMAYNAIATDAQRKLAQQNLEIARQQAKDNRDEKKASKETLEKQLAMDIQLVKDRLELQPNSKNADGTFKLSDEMIARGIKANIPMITELRDRGFVARVQGRASMGEDPEERINYMKATGQQTTTEGQNELVRLNLKALEATSGTKDKKLRAQEAQDLVKAKIDTWSNSIDTGDKTNPLALRSYADIKLSTAVVSNPAYPLIKDLAEGEKSSTLPIDPQQLVDRMVTAMAEKKVKPEDAARLIHSIGLANVAFNREQHKLYDYTGLEQQVAVVHVKPKSIAGDAISTVGTGIAAVGGMSGNLPAMGVGAALVATGTYMENQKVKMNILDPVDIQHKMSSIVAARLKYQLNLSGARDPNQPKESFYPPLVTDQSVKGN